MKILVTWNYYIQDRGRVPCFIS